MADKVSVSKTSLLKLKHDLRAYQKYLPSLDLKRQQLRFAIVGLKSDIRRLTEKITQFQQALPNLIPSSYVDVSDIDQLVAISTIDYELKSIAGVKVSQMTDVTFSESGSDFARLPVWGLFYQASLEKYVKLLLQVENLEQQIFTLNAALLKVTQRINLFEKLLIPRSEQFISTIELSLGERARESVVVSKLSKKRSASRSEYC
ncbi:V-type ATP synthase subunit D [Sessilibacter corallicola]|uniref:V-type ATP synthase subunit D n=1 Tax=Sessilibacter corallicola TaxID=2904075 RepID=UPI001E2A1957|nr:V-type ATP synthase subunit D [Sessilibacter corallicola]MCE2029087.1 V-type ATP synthase subunit D [Sessilibacter corallicola]